jgi:hypothetical protein
MVNTPNSVEQLGSALHYHPDSYWCFQCWAFTLDCSHLVPELTTRLVPVTDWLLTGVRYDRQRRILELHMNNGDAYQHRGVRLALDLELVRSGQPSQVFQEKVDGKFGFVRVRIADRLRLHANVSKQLVPPSD